MIRKTWYWMRHWRTLKEEIKNELQREVNYLDEGQKYLASGVRKAVARDQSVWVRNGWQGWWFSGFAWEGRGGDGDQRGHRGSEMDANWECRGDADTTSAWWGKKNRGDLKPQKGWVEESLEREFVSVRVTVKVKTYLHPFLLRIHTPPCLSLFSSWPFSFLSFTHFPMPASSSPLTSLYTLIPSHLPSLPLPPPSALSLPSHHVSCDFLISQWILS